MNSAGGEVTAALSVGQAFRALSARVTVPAEARCASSCVFLLAGAADRSVRGRVLIHRPYFTALAPASGHAAVRARIVEIDRLITGFLEEMDVARSLLDEMKAVPSEALRPLTERELAWFRLSLEDATQQERRIAQAAWEVGTSLAEQRLREVQVLRECQPDAPAFAICALAIRYGLVVEDYARREARAEAALRRRCGGPPGRLPAGHHADALRRGRRLRRACPICCPRARPRAGRDRASARPPGRARRRAGRCATARLTA